MTIVLRTPPPLRKVAESLRAEPMRSVRGRNHHDVIYAVVLREHPNIVKIGRSNKWHGRRKSYENWNLRNGDALQEFRLFVITEEFVDLPKLEKACLEAMPSRPVFGSEWFGEELDTACRVIDRVICSAGLSYDSEI